MHNPKRVVAAVFATALLTTGTAWASAVPVDSFGHTGLGELPRHGGGDEPLPPGESIAIDYTGDGVVYQEVEFFKAKTFFTEEFLIDTAGTYQVTLTDFEFLQPMFKSALNITTATDSLLQLDGPGSGTFFADPGSYYVSFFALAGHGWGREHGEYHRNNRGGHSGDEHPRGGKEHDDLEYEYDYEHGDDYGFERLYGDKFHRHGAMNFSQYGIEIAIASPTPVPVPAALWLFGSGLVGMVGMARRRRA